MAENKKKEKKPNKSQKKVHLFIVVGIFGLFYLLIAGFAFVYTQVFSNAQNKVLQVATIIPLTGDTNALFIQGLLTFCSILFGFYAVVLTQTLPKLKEFLKQYIKEFSPEYGVYILFGVALILFFFLPFYYLFNAVSYSLIGIGGSGYVSNAITNNNNDQIQVSTSLKSINSQTISYVFNATWYVLIDLGIYTLIELGVLDAIIRHRNKFLQVLKT